jgi:hypothetical protein
MIDVARLETDLEVARGDLESIGRLLSGAGVPETGNDGVPLNILYRVRIALRLEAPPPE